MTALSDFYNPVRGASQVAIDRAIVNMERAGIGLDVDYCRRQETIAKGHEAEALEHLRQWTRAASPEYAEGKSDEALDKTWASPLKLRALFHDALGLKKSPVWKLGRVKLESGQVKLDEAALDWIAKQHPERAAGIKELIHLRRTRGCIKYFSTLPDYVGADGMLHPSMGPASDGDIRVGAVTGRLAAKNPPTQQIPRNKDKDPYRVRRAFVAGEGNSLVVADYSQLEVVILAHICKVLFGDNQLAEAVAPGAPDLHGTNARKIFGELLGWSTPGGIRVADLSVKDFKNKDIENGYVAWLRDLVKAVWYGIFYGKGPFGFGATLLDADGLPIGEEKATVILDGLFNSWPSIKRYQEWVREFIKKYKGIPSLGGRWCDLSDLVGGDKWAFARAWRRALNYPMQAGGADIVGAAMVGVDQSDYLATLDYRLIQQVHDELILRGPTINAEAAATSLLTIMVNSYPLLIPLQCSIGIGDNYDAAK